MAKLYNEENNKECVNCIKCGTELKVLSSKYNTFLKRTLYATEPCPTCAERERLKKIEEDRIMKERQALIAKERHEECLKNSNMPKRYINTTFDVWKAPSVSYKKAMDRCQNYCTVSKEALKRGLGLYMFGKEGRGKTTIMACMVNDLLNQGYSCYIDNMVSIATKLFNKTLTIEFLSNVDFLFLDDVGTERYRNSNGKESWNNEKIYEFINERYNNLKPTIFSSNLDYSELDERGLFPKTIDRIIQMSNRKIEIKIAKSLRKLSKDEIENLTKEF